MKRRAALTALLTTAMLSACGFQLRGSNGQGEIPFKTIYISGIGESSPLGVELRRYLRAGGDTRVVSDPKAADATIQVLSESRDKSILSLNSQGRIREYSLFYKLRFRVTDNQGEELLTPTEIALKRDISFNESQAIAKEKEEDLLYRDMQSDLVQQILRRLAALKTA
ncbi:MAG TPA: LPS assembly lipoprotein LptE [Noviherbaspirillum sp.]